tara:strand:+ start:377 stop:1048 length:672 start_codon:yes stop_codon:yes gene_type:complete
MNIKNLFLFSATFFCIIFSNVSSKNIEDFGWSFQDDFFEVYSSIENSQPTQCELIINEFKLEKKIKPLWNDSIIKKPDIYHFQNDKFHNIVKNQYLPIIQHEMVNGDCDTDRFEQFTYCPVNNKIVQYEIDIFISPEQLLNNVHWNKDSEYFIGHSKDEILLKSSYWQGPSTRILAYNEKTNILRETQLIPIRITDAEVKGLIRHKFLKISYKESPYNICPKI